MRHAEDSGLDGREIHRTIGERAVALDLLAFIMLAIGMLAIDDGG